jgi:hypothetical protein
MTSIYDIPYEDIKIFLKANNVNYKNKDDAYDITLELLKDKKIIGHTTSIVEWMIAHNLLINKINIPNFTIDDIDNMTQVEINQLAKLLTMKGNNRENIKNILRYLYKLYKLEYLLPELYDIILNNLTQLEIKDLDISKLKYNDVINLLKTHRNKKEIRKFIYDNLEKIIIYNSLYIDFNDINNSDIGMSLGGVNIYNKNILIEIILDNIAEFEKIYNDKQINDLIKEAKENDDDYGGSIYIGETEMNDLVDFTFDLIKLNEIRLAKKVFDIANELHYFGGSYSYNYDLVDFSSIRKDTNILKTIIDFMGEDEFIENYTLIISEEENLDENFNKFMKKIVKLKKYDLLIKIIQIYIKKAILSKNDDLIIKYIGFINFG